MIDTGGSNLPPLLPPSPARECRSAGGYEACFYPGFVRRLSVQEDGSETLIYEQKGVFVLPPGQLLPWPSNTLELRGNGRDIAMQLYDPLHEIERVEIVLKPRVVGGNPERVVVEDGPVLCPPLCPGSGGI
ncbi:hypothetical protein [Longimicrobium sp.]|uniref:hypothetical protein n=1 Tax=Longimicrobium sp. TaxID=2029185 RepID=UPI003B3BC3BD